MGLALQMVLLKITNDDTPEGLTWNQQAVMALIRSICMQKTVKYQHMNCSSCMIYVDESSPFVQSQFPRHQALDQKPVDFKAKDKQKITYKEQQISF